MGDDVEFLDGDGREPDPDEDVLDLGPRRPVPHWAVGLIGFAVAAAVVLGLALGYHDHGRPAAASSAHRAPSVAGPPSAVRTGVMQLGAPSPLPATAPPLGPLTVEPPVRPGTNPAFSRTLTVGSQAVEAMALAGRQLFVLQPCRLLAIDAGTLHSLLSVPQVCELGDPGRGPWQLLPAGRDLWAVGAGARSAYRIDPVTLQLRGLVPLRRPASGAAVLDGHLYLIQAGRLFDVAPGASRAVRVPDLTGVHAVVADPVRHRLLLVDHAELFATVRWYVPASAAVGPAERMPFGSGDLIVADGSIWSEGAGSPQLPIVARLDPDSLTPDRQSPVMTELALEPEFVAAGRAVLWVRSPGTGGDLWCLAAGSGAVAEHWDNLPGLVASASGAAFVANGATVGRLRLDRACGG